MDDEERQQFQQGLLDDMYDIFEQLEAEALLYDEQHLSFRDEILPYIEEHYLPAVLETASPLAQALLTTLVDTIKAEQDHFQVIRQLDVLFALLYESAAKDQTNEIRKKVTEVFTKYQEETPAEVFSG